MIYSFIAAQAFVHIFFVWAQKLKNWGVIDIAWGLGFLVTTYTAALYYQNFSTSSWLVLTMVSFWGLRLAIYLFKRNHGKPEDFRYAQFREEWKPNENLQAYIKVFFFQGLLMFLITLPQLYFIKTGFDFNLGLIEIIGALVWLLGITFEVLADSQLANFKKDPSNKGKVMTKGVWSLSRHPNYFGEVCLWWGFYILLFSYIPWWTIVGPLLITFFIANVTGIPLLEQRYKDNQEFQEYKGRTNMFFPWFPKKA